MSVTPTSPAGTARSLLFEGSDADLYGIHALQESSVGKVAEPKTKPTLPASDFAPYDVHLGQESVGSGRAPFSDSWPTYSEPMMHHNLPESSLGTTSQAHMNTIAQPNVASSSRIPQTTSTHNHTHPSLPSAVEGRINDITASRQTESPESGDAMREEGSRRRRQKYTRSRTGCLACRVRRIKCDEGRPVCRRCQTSKRACEFPDPTDLPKRAARGGKGRSTSPVSIRADSSNQQRSSPRRGDTKLTLSQSDLPALSRQADARPFWNGRADPLPPPHGSELAAEPSAFSMLHSSDAAQLMASNSTPLLTAPNFLLPWFPTPEERSLILHYCANAADLMMAIPSGFNPMLAINLPLALDSPRGHNPSADALRVALLGTGAVHQAFLLARSQVNALQTASMFQHASNLRDTGKAMLRRACSTPGGGAGSDAALGASTALATIDIFFGGSGWQDNFNLARDLVAFRGGPAEMLKASQPTLLADGVTVSPARVLLEVLAIYETFGCLTSGEAPSLLSERWDSWWFEGSRSTYEEHSVEKQFGMSKIMVHLFSRIAKLLSATAKLNYNITEELGSSSGEKSTGTVSGEIQSGLIPTQSNGVDEALEQEARTLSKDIDCWITSLQLVNLEHERVQVGNRAYAHAMKILILRMVFKYPRGDPKVQNAALEVMQHCSISTAALGMSIDLTWPAIIGGCCLDGPNRQWVLTLLEGFKSQCCFDVETASRIISEVWRRVDTGDSEADWKPVCESLGMEVLLC